MGNSVVGLSIKKLRVRPNIPRSPRAALFSPGSITPVGRSLYLLGITAPRYLTAARLPTIA